MKILVVEDDRTVAKTLQLLLSSYNYAVDIAEDGEVGLRMADAFEYDLILLDVMLPKLDGVSLCQHLRDRGLQTPILLLTGQGGGHQKAIALNIGADDYVVKPFDTEELIARIQALLRRASPTNQPVLSWGALSVDPSDRKVTYGNHLLALTPKEYAILELFLRNPQKTLSASAILEHAWSSLESSGEEAVRVHIKGLRQKLTAASAPKDFIKTIHGIGYRLNPMYSSFLASQSEQQPTIPQITELTAVNEELRVALEDLRSTQAELHQKHQELETAYRIIEQERLQLQATRNELELRVAERTAELMIVNASLQQRQDQWQALFDHALDAIVITDDNGCFLEGNPAACQLFGVTRDTLLHSRSANFADPAVNILHLRQQFFQQGQMTREFCLHRPDGTTRQTEFTAIANFIPGHHLTIFRDISQRNHSEFKRQQAEAELRQREEFLRSIYTGADQAIFVIDVTADKDFRYAGFNPTAERYAGRTDQQVQGKTPEAAFGSAIGMAFRQNYTRCLQAGHKITYEEEVVLPDHTIWTLTILSPLRNEQGDIFRLVGTAIDITDRKQSELEIRQFVSLANNSTEFIGMCDTNFAPFYLNPAGMQMVGLENEQHYRQTPVKDFFFPEDQDFIIHDFFPRVLQEGRATVEIRFRHFKTGAAMWMAYSVSCIQDATNQLIGLATISRNITDRKQLEFSLQASEAKLSRILDSAIAAIVSFRVFANRDWEYDYFSAGCEALFGYSTQELMADKTLWLSRVVPDERETIMLPLFEAFFTQPTATAEYRFHHKDGAIRWISSTYASQPLGVDCWLVTAVNHDITDRKQLEAERQQTAAAIQHSAEQLRLTLELTYTGSWDWHIASGNITWNDNNYRLLGYQPGAVEPSYELWRRSVHPDDVVAVERQLTQALANQTDYEAEFRVVLPDGSVRWHLGKGRGLYNELGQAVRMIGVAFDVTERVQLEIERRQSEAALRENEQLLRLTLAGARAGSWDWEMTTNKLTWSPETYNLYGLDSAGVVPQYDDWYNNILYPDDRHWLNAYVSQAIEQRLPDIQLEFRIFHPQLGIRWLLSLGHLTVDGQGIPVRLSGINLDITDRKQAEVDLQESERKLRAIFDSTFEFMGLLTTDGIVVDANRAVLDSIAASPADIIGQPLWETPWWTHFPEQHQPLQQAIARAASGEFVRFETKHIWASGALAFVDFSIKPMFDAAGNVDLLIAEGRDVTARKLAEQKVGEQATLLDIASDAIVVRDLDHRILYWNQGAERLYGWQATEAVGHNVNDLLQNEASAIAGMMRRLLEQGESQGEVRNVTKTGKVAIVDARWTLVRTEAGQPKFILSVDTDLTEKKQLEAQFYRAQRLESLGTLASGIAHDLNNVLTPILAIAQLMRLKQPVDARSQEMLTVLEDSAKRGANLVKQILTFTRGTSGDLVPLQIDSLLHEVVNVARQTFLKSITVRETTPQQALWLVSADPTHLHQVLMNLCVNARDAMPDGGVLTLVAENCTVDAAFAQKNLDAHVGKYVVITVSDTGSGIDPAVRDRIFEPFFTTKQTGQSSGLGLSTVLGIVRNYGGFLQVFSEVGQGTQMKVYLPAIEGTPTANEQPEAPLEGNGELVLIVDDDVAVRQSTNALLESHHYTTLIAEDGEAAIVDYAHHQAEIQLVILDVMMPKMDGIALIKRLKAMNPAVKIITLSGLIANREPALAAGASAFLAKPYALETLMKTVAELVHAHN